MEAFVDEKMNLLDKGKMKEIQADFHGSMEEEEEDEEREEEEGKDEEKKKKKKKKK